MHGRFIGGKAAVIGWYSKAGNIFGRGLVYLRGPPERVEGERPSGGKRSVMSEKDSELQNLESLRTVTDEEIVTERTVPRRSFLRSSGALLAGAAGIVAGGQVLAQDDPDKRSEENRRRSDDTTKRSDDTTKRSDDTTKRSDYPSRRTDDNSRRSDYPNGRADDPDKRRDDNRNRTGDPARRSDDTSKRSTDPDKAR